METHTLMDKQTAHVKHRVSGIYSPKVKSTQIVVQRRSGGLGGSSMGGGMGMSMSSRSSMGMAMGGGVAGSIAHSGVDEMKCKRVGEKKDMQNLNDRLANYITQVRTLQAENKALREQMKVKRKEFDPEPMKEIYQGEIDESKKLLEEAQKENAELKISITSLEDELEDMRATCRLHDERIDALQDKVTSLNEENAHRTAECDMLRRKVEELEKQVAYWRAKYNEVHSQLQASRADLKDETNLRVLEARRAEALQEELDFLKTVTDAEIQEYKEMLAKEDHSGVDVRGVWTEELSKCMQELRDEYEQKLGDISDEMNARYESQLSQIRENVKPAAVVSVHSSVSRQSKLDSSQREMRIKELEGQLERMRAEIISLNSQLDKVNGELDSERDMRAIEVKKLHDEMESMIHELQMLMDAKLSLELEICAYRKLLEGEESRLSVGHLAGVVGGYRDSSSDVLANILSSGGGGGGGGGGGSGGSGGGGGGMGMSMSSGSASGAGGDSGRITMQRTSKGVMSIAEIDNNGRFITLENTSTPRSNTSVNLKGWKLERSINGTSLSPQVTIDFLFKNDQVISGEKFLKVWARKYQKEANLKEGDIVSTVEEWGQVNQTSTITLFDNTNAMKATMSIKAMV